MKAGLILLLVFCQLTALTPPSSAGQEALTIGKYDISFYLNSTEPYSVDAGEENGDYLAVINGSRHKAVVYLEEADCIGLKDAAAIVDELLAEAEAGQPEHYQRFIDGHRAILGVGSISGQADGGLLYTAAYPMYFGAEATGIYVLVGSNFTWEATRPLLDSLKVDLNRSGGCEARVMPTMPCQMAAPGSRPGQTAPGVQSPDYGLPLDTERDENAAEPSAATPGSTDDSTSISPASIINGSSGLIYGGSVTFSNGTGMSIYDAIVIKNASSEAQVISAEEYYLQETYGERDLDWLFISQELGVVDDRYYDRVDMQLAGGMEVSVFFDVTDFYGDE